MSNDPLPASAPDPIASSGGRGRDDFDKNTKETLAKRAGFLCSNPLCRRSTSGPHSDPSAAVNIGVASHITAASPSGPRFDPVLTSVERRQIANGIWLCQNCAKLVDNDVSKFTVCVLNRWKVNAEKHASDRVELNLKDGWARELPDELEPLISLELTTPPLITRNIARSPDGQFWLVEWNSQEATFHWSKVTDDYAVDQLQPVCLYCDVADWRQLFLRKQ